jgi:hypothetical protein
LKTCQQNNNYQCNILLSLIYLCGRCSFEENIIPRAAKKELYQFADILISDNPFVSTEEKVINLLSKHYEVIMSVIISAKNTNDDR